MPMNIDYERAGTTIFVFLVTSILGGIYWLVRRVFTNQKVLDLQQVQIDMFKVEMKERDDRRASIETETRASIREIERDVKSIMMRP
jgi:uncharacterized membrane protein (DUF106 family)